MKQTIVMIFGGLVLGFVLPTASFAETHKRKDSQGVTHYGDQPPPGVSKKHTNGMPFKNMNQIEGCGKPVLTTQEAQLVERALSTNWKNFSPQELALLKRHPLWNDFLLTADALKLYAQYAIVATGDSARKFYQENGKKTQEFFQNNPEIWNTLLRLQAAEACKDKLDNEIIPKMRHRLDNSPFEKFFITPSSNRFEEHTPAPSPD